MIKTSQLQHKQSNFNKMFTNTFNHLTEFNILSFYQQTIGANDYRESLKDPLQFQEIIRERKCKFYFSFFIVSSNLKTKISKQVL